jgi:hypothetical protein
MHDATAVAITSIERVPKKYAPAIPEGISDIMTSAIIFFELMSDLI